MQTEAEKIGRGMEGVLHEMMESMIFYRSFYDAIEELPDASRLKLLEAILRYGLYDEEQNLTGVEKSLWTVIRPLLAANKDRAVNGKKGGRPKKKPMVIENENHRLSNEKTIGYEKAKPNKNYNYNSNSNNNHHIVSENDDENPDDDYELRHEKGDRETYFKKTVKLGIVDVKQG